MGAVERIALLRRELGVQFSKTSIDSIFVAGAFGAIRDFLAQGDVEAAQAAAVAYYETFIELAAKNNDRS